jgi:hypothetical protein
MRIVGIYSFNNGRQFIEKNYPKLLVEIKDVVQAIDASKCRTKTSEEKTMPGKILYDPKALN